MDGDLNIHQDDLGWVAETEIEVEKGVLWLDFVCWGPTKDEAVQVLVKDLVEAIKELGTPKPADPHPVM